jgi:hypothetical protein
MAELILTDEEKNAALWSDLDDAALGKFVKKKIALITELSTQLDRITTLSAVMLICCAASEANADTIDFEIEGVTQNGRDFGNWKITATKSSAG